MKTFIKHTKVYLKHSNQNQKEIPQTKQHFKVTFASISIFGNHQKK